MSPQTKRANRECMWERHGESWCYASVCVNNDENDREHSGAKGGQTHINKSIIVTEVLCVCFIVGLV